MNLLQGYMIDGAFVGLDSNVGQIIQEVVHARDALLNELPDISREHEQQILDACYSQAVTLLRG